MRFIFGTTFLLSESTLRATPRVLYILACCRRERVGGSHALWRDTRCQLDILTKEVSPCICHSKGISCQKGISLALQPSFTRACPPSFKPSINMEGSNGNSRNTILTLSWKMFSLAVRGLYLMFLLLNFRLREINSEICHLWYQFNFIRINVFYLASRHFPLALKRDRGIQVYAYWKRTEMGAVVSKGFCNTFYDEVI